MTQENIWISTNRQLGAGSDYQPDNIQNEKFQDALNSVLKSIDKNLTIFGMRNPKISNNGEIHYTYCPEDDWVASFWCGQLWLAYALTGMSHFKNSASMRREYFQNLIDKPQFYNHDMGFLYSLSSVAEYRLTGNQRAFEMALRAAEGLRSRYKERGQYILSWNPWPSDSLDRVKMKAGKLIIDSMQNVALLFWAHQVTGKQSFWDAAYHHSITVSKYLIREDYSSFHTFNFDPATEDPLGGETVQGYSDDSCWARGQAWAIHGFAQTYLYTGHLEFLTISQKMTNYIIGKLPEDSVPIWDYNLPQHEKPYRDSSAGAITAAGIYILAKCLKDSEQALYYRSIADQIVTSLVDNYDLTHTDGSHGLLKNGASYVHAGLYDNMLPYGDYYYMEALMRALGHIDFFW